MINQDLIIHQHLFRLVMELNQCIMHQSSTMVPLLQCIMHQSSTMVPLLQRIMDQSSTMVPLLRRIMDQLSTMVHLLKERVTNILSIMVYIYIKDEYLTVLYFAEDSSESGAPGL